MAENQQNRPARSRLNDLQGWALRSPGHGTPPAATPATKATETKTAAPPPKKPPAPVKAAPSPYLKRDFRKQLGDTLNSLFKKSAVWKGAAAGLVASTALAVIFTQNASQPETEAPAATTAPTASASGQIVMGTGPEYAPAAQAEIPSAPKAHGRVARYSRTPRTLNRAPLEMDLPATELLGLTSPLEAYELTDHRPSRGFGRMFHPIRKRMRHHDGVDFKAPMGTPVYAISDGVIEQQGWEGGYGKTIRLTHSRSMQSLYAHLGKFAQGLKPGTKVRQGDLIGFVGSTGLSTGPHLHFEIRRNDVPIDPLKVAAQAAAVPVQNASSAFAAAENNIRSRTPSREIDNLMATSAAREGLDPRLMPSLFVKETGDKNTGKINVNAVSDRGATGLCQFTEQTFLGKMKHHGARLGFGKYAGQIDSSYSRKDGTTRYTAGDRQDEILNLRSKPEVAIPLCAAHIKDDLDYLKSRINRPLNFTDSSLAHFAGVGVAKDLILAYMNPDKRKDPAYTYADPVNYEGPTNRSIFFRNGDPKHPYTVEQVYQAKMRMMGTAPALVDENKKSRAPTPDMRTF